MIKRTCWTATICLLLCVTSAVAGVSPRLDSLRVKAFRQVDLPDDGSPKITNAIGNDAVNLAITWVCANAPAIERLDTTWVSSSVIGASLNDDFNPIGAAEMMWTDTTSKGIYRTIRLPLYPIPADSLHKWLATTESVQPTDTKNPLTWRYYRTFADRFLIYPPWTRSDSVQVIVQYYANDTLLQADSSETSVREKFLDAVIEYAAFKLQRKRNNLDDAMQSLNVARMYLGMPPVSKEELLEK